MNKEKVIKAMDVIDGVQQLLWLAHHDIKKKNKEVGEWLWNQSLQLEHALLVLNEEVLKGQGYYENEAQK